MMTMYVPDVGDGLAVGVRLMDRTRVQIDCGSQNKPEAALEKGLYRIDPHAFFLSHFHLDHYNGLLRSNHHRPLPRPTIRHSFYPRIPDFKQKEPFVRCMLAMNHWMMGDTSGSMAADFLNVLSRINNGSFTYQALSMGDSVNIGGSRFDVLWPPKSVADDDTLRVIATAIGDFNTAAEKDETLGRILDAMGESGEVQQYLYYEERQGELRCCCNRDRNQPDWRYSERSRDLPEPIRKANKSLRAAANHLSLAFHEDNKFLFLGDLEGYEINEVIKALANAHRDQFFVTVTPHHGTHWHEALKYIHTFYSISSVGPRLFRHLSPEFKSISEVCLATHLNGDVEVPMLLPPFYGMPP